MVPCTISSFQTCFGLSKSVWVIFKCKITENTPSNPNKKLKFPLDTEKFFLLLYCNCLYSCVEIWFFPVNFPFFRSV
ncbi:hypothetical protein RHMOL_Rhmol12G0027500 [Rhododendron molle]|uniref:Uncharacterized protein n=1 Tax=Rhododendron molle TaxID=49168 RepID=A0ACC0LEP2_RHOML|nr:hypothetical protein RHMOL_Rhmol12G0027500 [Rhododendron molle]